MNCNVYIDAFYQAAWVTLFNKNVVTFKETKVKSCNIKNKSGISNFKTFRFCFFVFFKVLLMYKNKPVDGSGGLWSTLLKQNRNLYIFPQCPWTQRHYHRRSVRQWRHSWARRNGRKLWVEDRFCWRFWFWPPLLRIFFPFRDALPDFDTSVTPEGRDPAKMKWMFKEDHSLGKKGGGGSGLLWNNRSDSISSCCEPSLPLSLLPPSVFLHPRSVFFLFLSLFHPCRFIDFEQQTSSSHYGTNQSAPPRLHRLRMTLQNMLTC